MGNIQTPLGGDGVRISPALPAQIPVADQFVQTLATLLGMAKGNRVPIRICQTGMLMVNDAKMTNVVHYVAAAPNTAVVGTVLQVSSLLVKAHPDNAGRIWIRTNGTAASNNAWPLDAGEGINIAVDCFSQASALIEATGDTLIVAFMY